MSLKILLVFTFALILPRAFGSNYTFSPYILIFQPQKKIVGQIVTFNFQSDTPPINDGSSVPIQGPQENKMQNNPIPIEISIAAREVNLEGAVIYPNSIGAENFVIYPSQFILRAGSSKKVQVQWIGETLPPKETAFGLIVTQLPLKFKEPKEKPTKATASVEIMTRYEGVIVIRPPDVQPEVKVDTAYSQKDSTGTLLVLILDNKGTGMQTLKKMVLSIAPLDQDGKIKLREKREYKDMVMPSSAAQSIFPGGKRKLAFPWPPDFPVCPINAWVTFSTPTN